MNYNGLELGLGLDMNYNVALEERVINYNVVLEGSSSVE